MWHRIASFKYKHDFKCTYTPLPRARCISNYSTLSCIHSTSLSIRGASNLIAFMPAIMHRHLEPPRRPPRGEHSSAEVKQTRRVHHEAAPAPSATLVLTSASTKFKFSSETAKSHLRQRAPSPSPEVGAEQREFTRGPRKRYASFPCVYGSTRPGRS